MIVAYFAFFKGGSKSTYECTAREVFEDKGDVDRCFLRGTVRSLHPGALSRLPEHAADAFILVDEGGRRTTIYTDEAAPSAHIRVRFSPVVVHDKEARTKYIYAVDLKLID